MVAAFCASRLAVCARSSDTASQARCRARVSRRLSSSSSKSSLMFSAPPSKLGWWVTHGERLGLDSAIREKSFRLELRLGSCSPEHRTAIEGYCKLVENGGLDADGSGSLLRAVKRRRTVVLNPTRVAKPGVVHLVARHTARGSDSGHLLSGLGE